VGLFSSKKSITNTSQLTDTTNVSLADLEDSVALAGIRDSNIKISVTQSDQGAIDAGQAIAIEGFDFIGDAFNENVELTRDVLNFADQAGERTSILLAAGQAEALGFGESALDFADNAQVEAFAFGGDAFDFAGSVNADAFAFSAGANAAALEAIDDLSNRSFDVVGDLANEFASFAAGQSTELRNAIGDIQQRESTNTDARLGDITRVALFVAGGIAIVAIGGAFLKKGK